MAIKLGSTSLGGTSELTVSMPIRRGFVNAHDTISYATRARLLLQTLHVIRKRSIEREATLTLSGPVERLRTIKDIRWAIIDDDSRLLLAVSFDRPWEPYIRSIAEDAGPVLDAILCNCEGYAECSSENGYPAFAHWVRTHQVDPDFFFTSAPFLTVDDEAYLSRLAYEQAITADPDTFDRNALELTVEDPSAQARRSARNDPELARQQAVLTLLAIHSQRRYYLPWTPDERDHIYLYKLTEALVWDARETLASVPTAFPEIYARHTQAFDWLLNKPAEYDREREHRPVEPIPDADIQGDILTPYAQVNHACLLLMRITNRAAFSDWLRHLPVTTEATSRVPEVTTNIAFTCQGLRSVGLSREELAALPPEFREGMEERGPLLGDVRANHHSRWQRPLRHQGGALANPDINEVELGAVDFVLLLQQRKGSTGPDLPATLTARIAEIDSQQDDGVAILAVQELWKQRRNGKAIEHFGFRDGIAQPRRGSGAQRYPGEQIPPGELVVGAGNALGDEPVAHPLLRGASFMVLRKLHQDVAAFREVLGRDPGNRDLVARKMMGRDEEGVPTTNRELTSDSDIDDFDYTSDQNGQRCPFHAHVRRANPRTARETRFDRTPRRVPRIARRGLSYGPAYDEAPDVAERGLLFIAYNASIAEQFEVIQRWVAGGNSTDVSSGCTDPLLGVPVAGQRRVFRFQEGGQVFRIDLASLDTPEQPYQFVKLLWGMYLLTPSVTALRRMAEAAAQTPTSPGEDPDDLARAERTLRRLRSLENQQDPDGPPAEELWKRLLEDPHHAPEARALWAHLRDARIGARETAYGHLIAGHDNVMAVFRADRQYSVREYWERMRQSIGAIYLGMDPAPQPMPRPKLRDRAYEQEVPAGRYATEAKHVNDAIFNVQADVAFDAAHGAGQTFLEQWQNSGATALSLEMYADFILGMLSRQWFGLPDDQLMQTGGVPDGSGKVHVPYHFLAPSRYIFPPAPTPFVTALAQGHGQALLAGARTFIDQIVDDNRAIQGMLLPAMFPVLGTNPVDDDTRDRLARTLVGAMHGFLPTCYGNFRNIAEQWLRDRTLWRVQLALQAAGNPQQWGDAWAALEAPLVAAMQQDPVPDTLHRVTTREVQVGGSTIPAGARVVIGIGSASRELAEQGSTSLEPVFGGTYPAPGGQSATAAPAHACPGMKMALGTLAGMFTALLLFRSWRPHTMPLVLDTQQASTRVGRRGPV